MEKAFNTEMNLLKALGILAIVSGHLDFALYGTMFSAYSYHLAIFFFVSGYFFKNSDENNFFTFIKKKSLTLLKPYFIYAVFYLLITILFIKITGHNLGNPYSLKEFFITPFLNGHQYNLFCATWFVPQLFISLISFFILMFVLKKIWNNKIFHLILFSLIGILSTIMMKLGDSAFILLLSRTMFSLFFIYIGYFYKHYLEEKYADKIFDIKWVPYVFVVQAILWIFNKDPIYDLGLSYILVWGEFDNHIIPILTSITGIWFVIFIAKLLANKVKEGSFLDLVGKNSYHIMANHLLVFYCLSLIFLKFNSLPFDTMTKEVFYVYYIFEPLHYKFIYFVVAMGLTTYSPLWVKYVFNKVKKLLNIPS